MDKRRQLPLPDGLAPSRRAPPALPVENDVPPPPVPSRPTPGRPSPSVPAVPTSSRPVPRPPPQQSAPVQEDVYDQAEVGPEDNEDEQQGYYDDMEVADDRQEEYADCEIEKNAPVAQELQETYDEFGGVGQEPQDNYDVFGGVAEDTLYQVEDKQEEEGDLMYQQCDGVPTDTDELYQIPDEDSPTPPPPPPSSAPSLPPPRPKFKKEETAAPPPPRDTAPKTYAPKGGVGIPAIAMGDIQNIKDRLKKVSVPRSEPEQKEPKLYTDSNEMKEKFKFFQQKEQEEKKDTSQSLLAKGNKPDISPKPVGLIKKPVQVKEDQTDSPVLPTRPGDKSVPSHRNLSDSLPPLPSPVNGDLPPLSEIPAHNRDLPPLPTSPATPQDLPSRGKDGYTKVNVGEEENNNEDIYDDALSFEDPLLREKWYFGEIDRMVGDKKLKKFNRNGAYLLRKSTKGGEKQPYTLMVFYKNHVYNLKIRERNDNRVALGEEKPDEMSFKSVTDLIKHHQTNDVILVHRDGKQDTTLLEVSPPK